MGDQSDWELLDSYAAVRSQEAFARLVAKYADMVFNTAFRTTGNRPLAEDVTQAVFIVLARSAGTLPQKGSLAGWLHKTALYAASNAMRSEQRRRRRERRVAKLETVTTDSINDRIDETAAVERELHRLPHLDQNLLAFHYLEGMTVAQAADRVGVSNEAARKRLARALEKLRSRLPGSGAASIGTVLGAIGTSSKSDAAHQIASKTIAGGKNGSAFNMASDVIRHMRLLVLGKAAAAIAVVLLTGAIGFAIAQMETSSPPVQAQQPAREVVPATQSLTSSQLPEIVRLALLRNASQLSPITIACTQTGSSRLSVDEAAATMKIDRNMADNLINRRMGFRIAYRDGKFATRNEQDGRILSETSFDGEFSYTAMNWNGRYGAMISKESLLNYGPDQQENGIVSTPYVELIGLQLPPRVVDLKEHRPPRSQMLFLLECGGKFISSTETELNGRRVVRIRISDDDPDRKQAENTDVTKLAKELRGKMPSAQLQALLEAVPKAKQLPEKRLYDFYFDPQLNYAMRRYEEHYENDVVLKRNDCEDFVQLQGRDLFLPRRCIRSEYTWANTIPGTFFKEPLFVWTFQATEIKLEPHPEGGFSLAHYMVPGVRVTENIQGKKRTYTLEEDGTQRDVP